MPTQIVLSSGTTFVSSLLPSSNLSVSAVIISGTDPVFLDSISFLKFTIPPLPVTTVDSAKLRLYVFTKTGTVPSPIVVNRVASAYDNATVTYDTMPPYTATSAMINIASSDVLSYVEIDVTATVNQWLNGTFVNNGIALTNSDGTTSVQIGGQSIGEAFEPQLIITYSEGPVGPQLEGLEVQLRGAVTTIASGAPVMFDTIVTDQSPFIDYNALTGEIIITETDVFYINWWVSADGIEGVSPISFSVITSAGDNVPASTPIVTGQLSGNALVPISASPDSPVILQLVNNTDTTIGFGLTPIKADLTIMNVNS